MKGGYAWVLFVICAVFVWAFGCALSKAEDEDEEPRIVGLDASRTPRGNSYTPRA